jgi:AmmeMemoRadiSam system protein A
MLAIPGREQAPTTRGEIEGILMCGKGKGRAGLWVMNVLLIFAIPTVPFGQEAVLAEQEKAVRSHGQREKEAVMSDSGKLSEEEGRYLLEVARRTIENSLFEERRAEPSASIQSERYEERRGTFVTLTIGGNLRGCIGHIVPQEALIEGIRVNAINAAFRDPRFRPLSREEFDRIKIEVSILTEPTPLSYNDADDLLRELRPHVDGVIIKKGSRQATFLPQVWEQLHRKEDFLTHLCLKAGLPGDAWRKGDLAVFIYQVQAFEE